MKSETKNKTVNDVGSSPFTIHLSQSIQLLLIAAVGLLVYSNTLHVPFQFDDVPDLVDNPVIKNLTSFISGSNKYVINPRRFIGYLSFALNYHFGGLNVTGYHIVNLAIHITSSLLVYFMVVLTFRTPFFIKTHSHSLIAFFSALLFAAHPVQTQAVTYIVQRFASLAAMFYLMSVVFYIKSRLALTTGRIEEPSDIRKRGDFYWSARSISLCALWLILSLLSALFAMKTKEIAFTLPLIIILYEFIFFKSTALKKLIFILPVFLTILIIPVTIFGSNRPLGEIISDISENLRVQTNLSRWDYLMTQMRVITTYIRLIFLPVNQNLLYDYPVAHSLFSLPVFLSFGFLISLFGTGIYMIIGTRQWAIGDRLKNQDSREGVHDSRLLRLVGFGILWFFITLSVESSIIPIADVIFEHRLYLPLAGALIAITASTFMAADKLSGRWKGAEMAATTAFALITVVLSVTAYARNIVWQDEMRLWQDVLVKSPGNARAHNSLGVEYVKKKMYDKALNEILIAISLDPGFPYAHNNLAGIYLLRNMPGKAIDELQIGIKLQPYAWRWYYNLGFVYYNTGQIDKARRELASALAMDPYNVTVQSLLEQINKK